MQGINAEPLTFGSFYKIPLFILFLQLIGLPVSWRWHHLPVPPHHQLPQADNWWENQRWQIHLIQLPLNEQRGTTSLWSFPFVRCIHSDYITWLSKWLCMHIIPSFLVDKASCTRQFESELSLHSLASLFPIKEGIFSNPSVSLSKGSSTSNVYHHYSVPTILQVVTRICFRKKLFYYRF